MQYNHTKIKSLLKNELYRAKDSYDNKKWNNMEKVNISIVRRDATFYIRKKTLYI